MSISKNFQSVAAEEKWYQHWQEQGFFNSTPDEREAYTVVIPPPNVTGVLHMGHMLNNTIQDVLVRRARLLGKNACWVPGTDHASIATEAKVVQKLAAQGIEKADLSREDFLKHAWEWTEEYGGTILKQLKRLGASCDWERTRFTLEDDLSAAVIEVFIELYNKGKIYRGVRMVNWDPSAQTAVSDEEVIHKELQSKLYYLNYQIEDSEEQLTIATTRPETILGDTAICINPNDERYQHLKGKKALVPLIDRAIPIIFDEYVDMEFGTGCLKVTPAHDINDYELGAKHGLESIDILNDDGTLNENATLYVGKDRFVVRDEIAQALKNKGYLEKIETLNNKVGFSERTNAVIEPKLSLQWFLKMEALSKPALEVVMKDEVQFFPENTKNTYRHWMENIKDWCISRQLWWGHRIPAYFYGKGINDFVVADTAAKALELAKEKTGNQQLKMEDLRQDEDVLDTWFSSWLWPISVFDGFKKPDNADFNYYYPTNDLVTAPEIMFFWVARMIMAGIEFKGEIPFKNVYYTGIVRDKQRRKMSKSLGNSPDPIELIEKYSADGVRVGMLLSSPAGNDLLFDESLCEQGRNFSNKIWNAFRLIMGWEIDEAATPSDLTTAANQWFQQQFDQKLAEINQSYDKFRMSESLMTTYKLVWDDFCSWYLEMIKPEYGKSIAKAVKAEAIEKLEAVLKVLNPFMPFITEEIWHSIKVRTAQDCLMVNQWPLVNSERIAEKEELQEIVSQLRNERIKLKMAQKEQLEVYYKGALKADTILLIKKLANLSCLESLDQQDLAQSISLVIGSTEYFIPVKGELNLDEERKKIEEEIKYHEGFLVGVNKKLQNERFVANAPEKVVEIEKQKRADAETKIELLKRQLSTIK